MDPSFSRLLEQFAHMAPTILVCTAGIILAGIFWSKNPRASILVFLGCGLQLLLLFTFTVIYRLVANRAVTWGGNIESMYFFLTISHSLLSAIAQALVLAAVFVPRKLPPPSIYSRPNKVV